MTPSGFLQRSKPINCQCHLKYWRNWKREFVPFKWLKRNKPLSPFYCKGSVFAAITEQQNEQVCRYQGWNMVQYMVIFFPLCLYNPNTHEMKKTTWSARAKQMKRMPLTKEHWVFRDSSWNTPGLRKEASEHQSFPLGWQDFAKE